MIILYAFCKFLSSFVCAVGKTANYAIVVAMLYTQGKNHGVHSFIVQLRDMETHEPLPGFVCLGVKTCLSYADNYIVTVVCYTFCFQMF